MKYLTQYRSETRAAGEVTERCTLGVLIPHTVLQRLFKKLKRNLWTILFKEFVC